MAIVSLRLLLFFFSQSQILSGKVQARRHIGVSTNPMRVELFYYVDTFFSSNKFAWLLAMCAWKTLLKQKITSFCGL